MVKLVRDGTNWRVVCTEKEMAEMDSFNREVAKLLEKRGFDGVTDLVDFALQMLYYRGDLTYRRARGFLKASDLGNGAGTIGLLTLANGGSDGYPFVTSRRKVVEECWRLAEEADVKAEEAAKRRAATRAKSKV